MISFLRYVKHTLPLATFVALAPLSLHSRAEPRQQAPNSEVRSAGTLSVAQLKTESTVDPVGVDTAQPSLSWTLKALLPSARGLGQSAYRILVATSSGLLAQEKGDLWDTGKVASTQTFGIAYNGTKLASANACFWKVMVWDQSGNPSTWSKPARWTMGLLTAAAWSDAHWIAATPDAASLPPAREDVSQRGGYPPPLPLFRQEFPVPKAVRRAVVFASGMGQYELRINGKDVTQSVLNPGWTNYRKTILYNAWDVTGFLRRGTNAIGVMLGNGMYNVGGTKGRYTKLIGSFGQPKLILQLRVFFTDGSSEILGSNATWKTAPGPIAYTSIYGGEDYDARHEETGWDTPAFHDETWSPAIEVAGPGGALTSQAEPPITNGQTYVGVKRKAPSAKLIYDLSQNIAGWPTITVKGPRGSKVQLTVGELLDANGLVTQHSMNASPEDADLFTYTLKGSGVETWHPRFSYSGFRYIQVERTVAEGSTRLPEVLGLRGNFLHANVPVVGQFMTSNLLFARIHKLIDMAILSNSFSVLTDCPHREKLGWLEQTHLAGASIFYNYDVSKMYAKMGRDMRDSQLSNGMVPAIAPEYVAFVDQNGVSNAFRDSPEWGSASVLSPWTAYQFIGDRKLLADNYEAMVSYAHYLHGKMQGGMLLYGLGDWYDIGPNPPGESQLTQKGMTATATYYEDLIALAHIATLLDKAADAAAFQTEAATVRDSINKHLFQPDSGQYDKGSQTANAMPLALGLVPSGEEKPALEHLAADIHNHGDHVTAGDIGFHYVVRALIDSGRSDVLNAMLLRKDVPSYGDQLAKGATTLTEAWDTNPDSSQNHFMLGHAEEWFYRGLAGIDFDLSRPAPRQIVIHPAIVSGTNDASASYDSVLGTVASGWSRKANLIRMNVTIPPGASAVVHLPTAHAESIRESGLTVSQTKGIQHCETLAAETECVVASGAYHFQFAP